MSFKFEIGDKVIYNGNKYKITNRLNTNNQNWYSIMGCRGTREPDEEDLTLYESKYDKLVEEHNKLVEAVEKLERIFHDYIVGKEHFDDNKEK